MTRSLKALNALHAVVGAIVVLWVLKGFFELDVVNYDAGFYHFPFALKLMGRNNIELTPWLDTLFQGYPPLAHQVQGLLATTFGRASLVGGINGLAFVTVWLVLRFAESSVQTARCFLLAVLAVPLLCLHLESGLIDLWLGSFLFLALYCFARWETTGQTAWLVNSGTMLSAACYSKYQAWPLAAVILTTQAVRAYNKQGWRSVAIVAVLAAVAMGWPVRNYLRYGNPTYPYPQPSIFGTQPNNSWVNMQQVHEDSVPDWLQGSSRPKLFLVSLLELNRFADPSFDAPWTADSLTPEWKASPHFRMGGYFIFTVVILLVCFGLSVYWRVVPTLDGSHLCSVPGCRVGTSARTRASLLAVYSTFSLLLFCQVGVEQSGTAAVALVSFRLHSRFGDFRADPP